MRRPLYVASLALAASKYFCPRLRGGHEFRSMTKQFTCGGLKVTIDDNFLECAGNRIVYIGSKEAVRTDLRKSHRILTAQDKTDRRIKSSFFSKSTKTG